jgi:hypothetical protein
VELLWWAGCPSHPRALEQLRAAMTAAGLDPSAVVVREVVDDAAAVRERFIGSPTIRVDGRDIAGEPDPPTQPPALTCRVYRRRDGRYSPLPDPDDLRAALAAAEIREP